jgi:hypothetical protein
VSGPTLRVERRKNSDAFFAKVRRTVWGTGRQVKAGYPLEKVAEEIALRALWNEFGTSRGTPERPFMRLAVRKGYNGYRRQMRAYGKRVLTGEMTKREALERVGEQAVRDIKAMIRSSVPPPNAPSTVKQKGHGRTLIDSGEMLRSATYVVED